jgi:hypothetical protein
MPSPWPALGAQPPRGCKSRRLLALDGISFGVIVCYRQEADGQRPLKPVVTRSVCIPKPLVRGSNPSGRTTLHRSSPRRLRLERDDPEARPLSSKPQRLRRDSRCGLLFWWPASEVLGMTYGVRDKPDPQKESATNPGSPGRGSMKGMLGLTHGTRDKYRILCAISADG